MKKVICVLCIILFTATLTSAAELTQIGVKGGVNFSTFSGDDLSAGATTTNTYQWSSKLGYGGGFFITISFNEKFSIEPEFLLNHRKVNVDGSFDTYLQMTYAEIPILFRYSFPLESKLEPNLYLGPYIGFKNKMQMNVDSTLRAEIFADEDVAITGPALIDIKNAKSVDYGLVFGAGTSYTFDFGTLLIDFRYVLGLTKLLGDYQDGWNLRDENFEGLDIKTNSIMVFLGITI